jgi:outer membrane protein assembly factor BamB
MHRNYSPPWCLQHQTSQSVLPKRASLTGNITSSLSPLPCGRSRFSSQHQRIGTGTAILWLAILTGIAVSNGTKAAVPPSVAVAWSAPGPIYGGVALGNAGQIFFAVSGTQPQVIGLNSSHSLLWTPWLEPYGQRIQGIPLVSPDGSRIFFGSDAGIFYCLSTVTGQTPSGWTDFMVPEGVDRRIRSGAAYDAYAPSGPAVYFHGFNGYLYALSATSGALRWRAVTGNGVPPGVPEHPQTEAFASSPVIGAGGTVYVGSTDGYVYAFDAGTGTRLWRVNVGRPIEASLAIGSDGWVFVATRHADDSRTPESDAKAAVLAINPAKAAFNPSQAIEWENAHDTFGVGYLASPVIDQGGFVYTAEFHNEVKRWHPKSGVVLKSWVPGGKICQTPSLNQDGLLILGTSTEG